MKILKKAGLTLFALIASYNIANAQILREQARPVDSLLTHTYLSSPTFHSMSVLSPNLSVWTAGSGYKDNKYVNWTHTGEVSPENIALANSQPNQYLEDFDLNSFNNPQEYQSAVENWLEQIGLPVGINDNSLESKIYPNPTLDNIKLINPSFKPNQEYNLTIYDVAGRKIKDYQGITSDNGLNVNLDLSDLSNGMYIIRFDGETSFSQKVIKQ
jgi:hypothetical protein